MADEMQPPAGTLPLGAHTRVREPDRRHQVAASKLGQHPGIDAVGLAGQRCEAFHLLRVRDLDLPTVKLEPIVHEARTVHRLDRCTDRLTVQLESLAQAAQPVRVGR